MSWTFDEAMRVPPVGDLGRWFFSSDSPPVAPPINVSQYPRRYDLLELVSLDSFWDELGRGSLTKAVAALCVGVSRINARMLVSFQRDQGMLAMIVGIGAGSHGGSGTLVDVALPLLQGALPSAKLRPLGVGVTPVIERLFRGGHAVALAGAPRVAMSPPERPLIEVLDATGADRWSLTVEAEPVDAAVVNHRLLEIDLRIQELSALAGTTTKISPTVSRTDRNVDTEGLITLLERERERTQNALRRGAFVMSTWLSSDRDATVVALAGVAASTLASAVVEPRGLVVIPARRGGEAPGSFVSADELAAFVHPPLHDVPGLRVAEWSRFDENAELDGDVMCPSVKLGSTSRGLDLRYPRDRLTAHALVTGITGSGKSSFIGALLRELEGSTPPVPYLIVEPTKDEYRPYVKPERIWAVGDPRSTSFRLNPFEVPTGTPVQTHVDVLIALFTNSFSLVSPLPFVLEIAIRQAYEARGWDFATNLNEHAATPGRPLFPSFSEVLSAAEEVVEQLGYQGEVRHNVRGALRARLGAMTVGAKGAAFDTDRPFDMEEMLSGPFVVNLDLVGSDEEKSFIIGLLLVRLWGVRRGSRARELTHVVVLEEAHRVLRRESSGVSDGEHRSGSAFASELFANLLAEVRAAGQGIVVVDQSPRKLSSDALANTALKVAFRSTYQADKLELASALNLDESQQRSLTGMPTHQAVVFWEGMDRPVRAHMASHFPTRATPSVTAKFARTSRVVSKSPAAVAPVAVASSSVAIGAALRDLVGLLVRVSGSERAAVESEALRLAGASGAVTVAAAIGDEVERLGMSRRWAPSARDALTLDAARGGGRVREKLLDGYAPMRACSSICPATACLLREAVGRTVRVRRADVMLARDWSIQPTPVLKATIRRDLGVLDRSDLAPGLARTAMRCLAAHVLEDRVSDADVRDVLERLI